jgi:hypothetical protein
MLDVKHCNSSIDTNQYALWSSCREPTQETQSCRETTPEMQACIGQTLEMLD